MKMGKPYYDNIEDEIVVKNGKNNYELVCEILVLWDGSLVYHPNSAFCTEYDGFDIFIKRTFM